MSDVEIQFHKTWLGMVQPIDGLVVSMPVLVDAQCMNRQPPSVQKHLVGLCPPVKKTANGFDDPQRHITDLPRLLEEMLQLVPDLFDRWDDDGTQRWAGNIPEALSLYVPEGRQTIHPTLALQRFDEETDPRNNEAADTGSPAGRVGLRYVLLVWDLPDGLDLDKPETVTGPWEYPPSAKFERLLRHCRVPIGLLTNRREVRLVYAPHGESSGSVTFRVDDMVTTGGRPILDAFIMLLSATRILGVEKERQLPAILKESRRRQADVTNALSEQLFDAVQLLLSGFEAAAERDGWGQLEHALGREDDHLYSGLLTMLLRLVFLLYAEDKGLLPVEHRHFAQHMSLLSLFDQLQQDRDAYPDSMSRRFGAWGRIISLCRAVYRGVDHGDLYMPARRGELFDPHRFAFLEGWDPEGTAPVLGDEARSAVRLPSVDDGTVLGVLEKLIILEGQWLSYRALYVEQIGSVYEGLMGFHVERLEHPSVCLRPGRRWVSAEEIMALPASTREKWLVQHAELSKADAEKLAGALKSAAGPDEALAALALHRVKDTFTAQAGRLVIQPGKERQHTSSHYTPRSLSAPIVARTLAPLFDCMGDEPSSEALLNLKICDPAMGSGAFLVEACRYLAEKIVAAWTREKKLDTMVPATELPENFARRLVAQRCLYGVDKNPFAVNLAKLSLWLVTMAKDLPFTFVDHALRCGDSLVGLSLEQIRSFHWKPGDQLELFRTQLDKELTEALETRKQILDLAFDTTQNQTREKERLLDDAEDALDRVRAIGDVIVGAYFSGENDKERERIRNQRYDTVVAWLRQDNPMPEEVRRWRDEIRSTLPVFHWAVEFPEIFYADRPDPLENNVVNQQAYMDAFIGNPPFAGKNGIDDFGVPNYLSWLKELHPAAHGNSDYCAHFFRRAERLLGANGTIGLIATNTISQGDTRTTGLQWLVNNGCTIYDATRSRPWPGAAAVTVAVVHLAKGIPIQAVQGSLMLDGQSTSAINSRLRAKLERPDPQKLAANANLSFVGSYVLGMGFTLVPEERDVLIARDKRNAERIFPYIGGEEVNTSPTQDFHRYVINFGQMSMEEASEWPDLIKIVREKVKPERDILKNNPDGRRLKQYWWQHCRIRPELYQAIQELPRCLVTARVTKHLVFTFQPIDRVFAETTYIFPLNGLTHFALLQSRVHEIWAWLLSSTMRDAGIRYSATDCFENFPFPDATQLTTKSPLEKIGKQLYETRAQFMVDTDQGLTKTYNALKDPDCTDPRIIHLRELHEEMDRAVLAAYGWDDISVPAYGTPATPEAEKALQDFSEEVIDRLFVLNAERAEAEQLQGAAVRPPVETPRAQREGKAISDVKPPAKTRESVPSTRRRRRTDAA